MTTEASPQGDSRKTRQSGPWHEALATAAIASVALFAYLCTSFGLFLLAASWVTPLVVGGIAGAISSPRWKRAVAGTAIGLAVGVAAARPWFLGRSPVAPMGQFAAAAFMVVLGAAFAGAVAYVLAKARDARRAEWAVAVLLVAAIVGGMWLSTTLANRGQFSAGSVPLNQILSVRPELGNTPQDYEYYLRLFYDVHDHQPYYESVAKIWLADSAGGNSLPIGVTSYRMPTIFYLWLLLPRDGAAIPWAFLVFATVAVASGFSIGAQLSRPSVAVLGALTVAVAYLLLATSPWVTFVDGWAVALALAGTALFIASICRESRRLLWAAVAAFFAGAVLRELMIYPMILAAATALMVPKGQRWRAARPWLVALGAFVLVYAAHVMAVAGRVSPTTGYSRWLSGGVSHLLATVQFFAPYFGGRPWLMPVLVVTGIIGAILVRGRQVRLSTFLASVVIAPLVAFLVFGNGGEELSTGAVSGYWGILVVPFAMALAPVAVDRALVAAGVCGVNRGESG